MNDQPVVGPLDRKGWCTARSKRTTQPCGQRAGAGTDHPGVGPCKWHGGRSRVLHGRYSNFKAVRLGDLLDRYRDDPAPLDLFEELAASRALLAAFLERHADVFES